MFVVFVGVLVSLAFFVAGMPVRRVDTDHTTRHGGPGRHGDGQAKQQDHKGAEGAHDAGVSPNRGLETTADR